MQDVLFVAVMVAFFALAAWFVKACEKIIGPDVEGELLESTVDALSAERAA